MVQHEAGVHTQVSFARHTPIGGLFLASGIPVAAANTAVTFILSALREMVSSFRPNWMVNGWIRRKDVLTSIKPLNDVWKPLLQNPGAPASCGFWRST